MDYRNFLVILLFPNLIGNPRARFKFASIVLGSDGLYDYHLEDLR